MIGITFALPAESSDLRSQLRDIRRVNDLLMGKLENHNVALLHTGVGAKNCNQRMEQLLHKARPRLVVSSGFAGAVVNDLQVNDLVFGENFSDADLLKRAEEILRTCEPRAVKIFTAPSIIDSIAERNEIARGSGAAAVDMETGSIVEICQAHGVPLLSLRAISDTPSDPLPAPADVLFDVDRQQTDLRKLFAHFIVHPSGIIRIISFARRVREIRAKLTEALVELIREF